MVKIKVPTRTMTAPEGKSRKYDASKPETTTKTELMTV